MSRVRGVSDLFYRSPTSRHGEAESTRRKFADLNKSDTSAVAICRLTMEHASSRLLRRVPGELTHHIGNATSNCIVCWRLEMLMHKASVGGTTKSTDFLVEIERIVWMALNMLHFPAHSISYQRDERYRMHHFR